MINSSTILITAHDGMFITFQEKYENLNWETDKVERWNYTILDLHCFLVQLHNIPQNLMMEMYELFSGAENTPPKKSYTLRLGDLMLRFEDETIATDMLKRIIKLKFDNVEDWLKENPEYQI